MKNAVDSIQMSALNLKGLRDNDQDNHGVPLDIIADCSVGFKSVDRLSML